LIHNADPIKYGLIFSRFLNKFKTEFPDIDSDVASFGKPLVYNYIVQKYGADYVAGISNVNTITPKVYGRDIARAHQFGGDRKTAVEIGTSIADAIPSDVRTIDSALKSSPLFVEFANNSEYAPLKKFALDISGLPRAWSTHAGGLVIGKRPLHEIVPVRRDKDNNIVIEYEKERVEENGLVKMDLLGVSTLDVVDNTLNIAKASGKPKPTAHRNFDANDKKTYDLISRGDTLCVFQLGTSGGTIDLCRKVQPKSIEDVAIINSLARPAARDIRKDFILTKNGEKEVEIMHPTLNRAFGGTYGFGLYEECLMYLANDVAKWDLHEADRLRKLTKQKGKYPKKIRRYKKEFIKDAINNNVSEEMAKRIWNEVVDKFQGYGFNKSLYFLQKVDIYTNKGRFLGQKAIANVEPGEYVRSRDEHTGKEIFVEVNSLHDHGSLQIVEVELNSGEKIRCTMNHKFRVQENGQMLPLWKIIKEDLSIVVDSVEKTMSV
jgi:DNA polymerase-3 subunit alpha